ncbi:MAG TPA: transglutaminase family protein [Gemmatimonadaceae bacterium]|nr:transglutaminase family protein [Gemmatimonadaceae bacterium]
MKVHLEHITRLDYNTDVVEGVMDVRLGPFTDADQRWDVFTIAVSPSGSVRRYTDGFGNRAHLITVAKPHRMLEVVTRCDVVTSLADPFSPPLQRPRPLTPSEVADYLSPSALVPVSAELAGIAQPYRPASPDAAFESVRLLSKYVHDEFTYTKNVTTVATTVEEVLRHRTGVCQDFAHLLIGLCRSIGIPARYVSGYTVSTSAGEAGGAIADTEASHAWAEAYTPLHGWRGFDPTNDLVASTAHIKMAIGRDYADVPPTRGTFRGQADERLTVTVETRQVE